MNLNPRRHLLVLVAVVIALAACSADGGVQEDGVPATDTTGDVADTAAVASGVEEADTTDPTEGVSDTALTGPASEVSAADGRILVSSTPVTGHKGHLLLILGPDNESKLCATIENDPWMLEEAALTDRTAESDPCTGSKADTTFGPGEHAVTASIYAPDSRTALNSTAVLVELTDGDVQLQLDGGKLSGTRAGDHGRISVTVTEITGQKGKILVVLGQNNMGSLCAMIDSDPWALPIASALRELPGDDSGPCSESTPEALFPAGDTRLTAAVVIPGSPSPEAAVEMIVPVDGDGTTTIDGGRLSG